MKITTWNVNSIRRRLDAVVEWTGSNAPDVLCLQETKCVEDQFPWIAFRGLGYEVRVVGQKAYNGVAILSRIQPEDVEFAPVDSGEGAARSIAATIGPHRILNVYVPHGDEVDAPRFHGKLAWLERLARLMRSDRPAIVSGDFNVAPDDRDAYDPAARREKLICSTPERECFGRLLDTGYLDALRQLTPDGGHYTWWSHRVDAVRTNRGLRVDHHLVHRTLASGIRSVSIDRAERERPGASDHAPVTLELAP
jgi:exodeoxyribonuclease-3